MGRAFGPEYFAPNFGLFFTTTVAYFSIIIILSQVSPHHFLSTTSFFFFQIDVLFNLLGFSGLFLIAGGVGAFGVIMTALMSEDISYERENKKNNTKKNLV